jgi:hypothetical protein
MPGLGSVSILFLHACLLNQANFKSTGIKWKQLGVDSTVLLESCGSTWSKVHCNIVVL